MNIEKWAFIVRCLGIELAIVIAILLVTAAAIAVDIAVHS